MTLNRTREYLLFWHAARASWMVATVRRDGPDIRHAESTAVAVGEPPWVAATAVAWLADRATADDETT